MPIEVTGKSIVTLCYLLFLLYRGTGRQYGFATWHMFSRSRRGFLHLYYADATGKLHLLNPWQYLPHTLVTLDRQLCERFLSFLRERCGIAAHGEVRLLRAGNSETWKIVDGHLVA